MKVERTLGLCLTLLLPFLAEAAPEPAAKRGASFATVPKQALVELKATVGKPFSAGLVFVNGKFLDPPYKVERYGTALRINGIQVTNEIIPWTEFLKTQAGARIEKVDPPPAAAAPVQAEAPAAEEPETSDSSIDDIDDLFDDDPKPKKKVAAKPAVKRTPKAAPPPQPTTIVVLDGEFKPNDKTKQMIARINKARTRVETTLRNGGCYFFGARYMPVSVDRLPTEMLLSSLPDVMKSNTSFEQFSSAARAKGLTFISENVMRELFRNRLDYIRLQARAKAVKEGGKWGTTL
jgi:hypothetical protein